MDVPSTAREEDEKGDITVDMSNAGDGTREEDRGKELDTICETGIEEIVVDNARENVGSTKREERL